MQLTHLREIIFNCFIIFGLTPKQKHQQQNKTNNKERNKQNTVTLRKHTYKSKKKEKQQALTASHSLDYPTI